MTPTILITLCLRFQCNGGRSAQLPIPSCRPTKDALVGAEERRIRQRQQRRGLMNEENYCFS